MSDETDKQNPAEQLREGPAQPQQQAFYLVTPALMQQLISRLSKQKASKVHGLLNALNQCQTVTAEVKNSNG